MLSSNLSTNVVRALSTSSQLSAVSNLTVIGAGLMGSGISQVSAAANIKVTLIDQNDEVLANAQKNIASSVQRVAKKKFPDDSKAQSSFIDLTLSNLKTSTDVASGVKDADLVIEAIVENLDIKKKLFEKVEQNTKSSTLICTNTSSLRLADIGTVLKNRSRFGGLHFFNPVPMMKLLEVVRHDETSDATFDELVNFGKKIGKVTVACKDTPGFIVNRLLVPYMFEALRMYERGDASMKDIDTAMKLGAGYPMGPFELSDYVGLDTSKFIMDGWHAAYPEEPLFMPSPLLNKLVEEKKFGRKTGEGFYQYKK